MGKFLLMGKFSNAPVLANGQVPAPLAGYPWVLCIDHQLISIHYPWVSRILFVTRWHATQVERISARPRSMEFCTHILIVFLASNRNPTNPGHVCVFNPSSFSLYDRNRHRIDVTEMTCNISRTFLRPCFLFHSVSQNYRIRRIRRFRHF